MEIETTAMEELVMASRIQMGNGEDFLFMHKHHMTQLTPSHISKVVITNNLEKLTPWSC
jgi:hypothetical protein